MNSVLIGTHQMDTEFGLYLPEYSIPAPVPQTKFINVIGRDGAVDLSNAFGSVHYNSREWNLDFKHFDPVNWHTISSSVFNAIHGKRLDFTFDDDPNYHWTGRFIVQDYTSKNGCGTLKVRVMADPFKYKNTQTTVSSSVPVNEQTLTGDIVTINNNKAYEVNSLGVSLSPIQDLHGYANPWPAGGGVNKFDASVTTFKKWQLVSNAFEPKTDGFEFISFSVSGDNITLTTQKTYMGICFAVDAVDYDRKASLNGTISGGKAISFYDGYTSGATRISNGATSCSIPANTSGYVSIRLDSAQTCIINFQIEQGSTASSWTPYSNICPITGRTGVTVYVSPTPDPGDATTYSSDWTSPAGTVYGGTLDVVTGLLTVDRVCETITKDSAWFSFSTGTGNSSAAVYLEYYNNCKFVDGISSRNGAISSTGKESGNYWYGPRQNEVPEGDMCFAYSYTGFIRFHRTDVANITDLNAFKSVFPDTQICYYLATPLTYQLTPQEVELLTGTNNIWSEGQVSVVITEPIVINNPTLPVVPTVTASAPMTLRWNAQSYSMDAGTRVIPQLTLQTGNNPIYVDGEGTISFAFSEASL